MSLAASPPFAYAAPVYRAPLASAVNTPGDNATAADERTIAQAVDLLQGIQHRPGDEAAMQGMGVDVIFHNGQEAYNLLQQKGVRVIFADMGDSSAHAEWSQPDNTIHINQKYRGDDSRTTLYAISEALYHEAGHVARAGDAQGSIQEEINCLALNTLAYRYHTAADPVFAQAASSSRLITDGVALYPKLFFDADPEKTALVNRVITKYGMLPVETPDHRVPQLTDAVPLADRVVRKMHDREVTFSDEANDYITQLNAAAQAREQGQQQQTQAQSLPTAPPVPPPQKSWTA